MKDYDLTIAIPTYRNQGILYQCLYSLVNYTEYPYHIVIVNNDPIKEARVAIDDVAKASGYKYIDVLHMESNAGWMGALNAVFAKNDSEFFCCLNDDVVFIPGQPDFWRILVDGIKSHNRIGATGPCSNYVMGAQQLFVNAQSLLFTRLLIGFCMVSRSEAIEEVGGWDETLPGGDDLDISIRLRKAGWDLLINRLAYLHHIGQSTGKRLFGDGWDSKEAQEITDNAIIRKHGVRTWHEIISHKPINLDDIFSTRDDIIVEHDWINSYIDPKRKGISVGCGENNDNATWGIDINRSGNSGAGGLKFAEVNPNITGDGVDLPIADESLDYIVASHVFEHIVNPFDALREWSRVLKDGGILIITMPDHDEMNTIAIDHTHVHAYTPKSFGDLIEANGLFDFKDYKTFDWGAFGYVLIKTEDQ